MSQKRVPGHYVRTVMIRTFSFLFGSRVLRKGRGSEESNTHNPKIPEFKWESSSCCEYKTALPFSKVNLRGKSCFSFNPRKLSGSPTGICKGSRGKSVHHWCRICDICVIQSWPTWHHHQNQEMCSDIKSNGYICTVDWKLLIRLN